MYALNTTNVVRQKCIRNLRSVRTTLLIILSKLAENTSRSQFKSRLILSKIKHVALNLRIITKYQTVTKLSTQKRRTRSE